MNLWLMAPEIGMAGLALLVLALDLIFLRSRNLTLEAFISGDEKPEDNTAQTVLMVR
jgi:hypothetical protein